MTTPTQATQMCGRDESGRVKLWLLPGVSIFFGLVYLVAGIVGGQVGFGLFGLGLMTAVAAGLMFVRTRSETVKGLLDRRDERINALDLQATALSGMTVVTAVIIAFVVQIARGHDPAPYSWLGALGGVSYLVALVTLRLRG